MSDMSTSHHHDPGRYEIRLRGHFESRWAASFDGMTLTHVDDGSTVLTGQMVDQTALHGLPRMVRDLGLPLLAVSQVPSDLPAVPPIDPR